MSGLLDRQREVITSLQTLTKKLANSNAPSGAVKDAALALAASIDKLEVLVMVEPRVRRPPREDSNAR